MDVALETLDERLALLDGSEELVAELSWLPAGDVLSCLVACRDELEQAGVQTGLAPATLAMARTRLLAAQPAPLAS